jgi:Uma2 family endonuclease
MNRMAGGAGGEVVVYEAPDGQVRVDVRLERETVWLSLNQMAELFDRDKSVISRHLRGVFTSGELERAAVVAKNATTAADGKTYQVEFYNLDAILSVGYRVNSKRGTQFRIWATRTLKDHLVRGYTLNERRLREQGLGEMEQAVGLLARTLTQHALVTAEGRAVLDVVQQYSRAWRLLLEYDEDRLAGAPARARKPAAELTPETARVAIGGLRDALAARGQASGLCLNADLPSGALLVAASESPARRRAYSTARGHRAQECRRRERYDLERVPADSDLPGADPRALHHQRGAGCLRRRAGAHRRAWLGARVVQALAHDHRARGRGGEPGRAAGGAGRGVREAALPRPGAALHRVRGRGPRKAHQEDGGLTDRNDLDDQLFGTFARCRDLLRQPPVQAADRADLRAKLSVASGGVVFTTIQKFFPEEKGDRHPVLSERRNIVVIADEAHRSQYDFIDGFARHMRDALPHASFIGFTGTPIEKTDANTRAVFGDYISVYDIQRAVTDGATVPIYYESRLAKLELKESERPKIDPEFEEATEGEEVERKEKLKTKWAQLEAVVGSGNRIKLIARDLVEHFENRLAVMDGKAMVVGMSRRICVELYREIVALRPAWHADAAVALMLEKHEVCRGLFHGFDWSRWTTGKPQDRLSLLPAAQEHILAQGDGKYSPHATSILLVQRALTEAFGPGWLVRSQMPVALDDESEPEPDVAVVPGDPRDYRDAHPARPVLVVEVALSRVGFDREHKGSLYARAGVADYWIVNLPDRRLEVYRGPVPDGAAPFGGRYGSALALGPEERVAPLAAPGASVTVADLLP